MGRLILSYTISRLSKKNSINSSTPISKSMSYHVTSFSKNVLILRSCLTKWLRNMCRFPNWSFRINLKNRSSSHISIDKLAFSFFRIYVDFSLKPVYPTMVGDKFQIDGVQITGKCICESKNRI